MTRAPAPPTPPPAPPTTPWPVGDVLLVAVGFGLLAGVVEALAAAIRQSVMDRTLYMGPEFVWQLPLADGAVFLVIGILLLILSAFRRTLRAPRVVIGLFAALATFSGLLLTERIHVLAEAVLAAGLGVGISRGLGPRNGPVRRAFRIGVPAGLLVAVGLAFWIRHAGSVTERRELASRAAAGAGHPNILLLVLDTVRAWNLGFYGYGRSTTPNLNRWAAQGTLFERALAPAPWTTLSHAVMFTGRYPTELSVGWRTRFDGAYPTLAEVLRDAGYATAGFAGNYLNVGRGTGLAKGFVHYDDYPLRTIPILRTTTLLGRLLGVDRVAALVGRRRMVQSVLGSTVNREFLEWLDGQGSERPWFAFINYFDAHGPYLPPSPFDTMYMETADPSVDRYWENVQRAYGPPPLPVQLLAISLDAYDGAITYLDRQVDTLLQALSERGQLGNTIVVVTSDHGELFGEHGILAHGNNLYLPVLHVPLLFLSPGRVPGGARLPSIASLRDLPATLLDLARLPNPGLPGHSLTPLWTAGGGLVNDTLLAVLDYHRLMPKWPPTPILRGSMRTVVLDSLQYILNGDGQEELYHLGQDPWEVRNLVAQPAYQADLTRYRAALQALPRR